MRCFYFPKSFPWVSSEWPLKQLDGYGVETSLKISLSSSYLLIQSYVPQILCFLAVGIMLTRKTRTLKKHRDIWFLLKGWRAVFSSMVILNCKYKVYSVWGDSDLYSHLWEKLPKEADGDFLPIWFLGEQNDGEWKEEWINFEITQVTNQVWSAA